MLPTNMIFWFAARIQLQQWIKKQRKLVKLPAATIRNVSLD